MFATIIDWIEFKLLLHVPLWVCGVIGLGGLLLPESLRHIFILILFFSYFVLRYVWRRHLKQQGKLGKTSSGLFSLIFWGITGAIALYASVMPHDPELAVYVNGAAPDESGDPHFTVKHGAKRSVLSAIMTAEKQAATGSLACQYAKQEKLLEACSETKAITLDNNPETLEVLALTGNPRNCGKENCRLWLIQTSSEQLATYEEHKHDTEKAEPLTVKASIIANWDKVLPPVQIGAENTSAWRQMQIRHVNGQVEDWNWTGQSH